MTKLQVAWLLGTALALTGCQQKSVIDKCVEAQAIALCNRTIENKPLYKLQNNSESQCIQDITKSSGGDWQLECLKAQSGKE